MERLEKRLNTTACFSVQQSIEECFLLNNADFAHEEKVEKNQIFVYGKPGLHF